MNTTDLAKAPASDQPHYDLSQITPAQLRDSQLFNEGAINALGSVLAKSLDHHMTRLLLNQLRIHQSRLAGERIARKHPGEPNQQQNELL